MNLPAAAGIVGDAAARIDRHHHALRAEALGRLADELGAGDGGGVDRDLVRPALSSARTSSTVRTPPPTVSGMKTRSAVRATTSRMIGRSSCEAVMSRKQSSSAPSAS